MRKKVFLAGLSVYIAALPAIARQKQDSQQNPPEFPAPPQAQNPPSTEHKIRVWTNEDLIAARTPADIYIFEKEAKAAASEMAAFRDVVSCFAFDQPEGTLEETQKAIAETLQSIRDSEEAVAQARAAVVDAPENLKARNQMELDRRTSELQSSREQLRLLQNRLRKVTGQAAGNVPPASPRPEDEPPQ